MIEDLNPLKDNHKKKHDAQIDFIKSVVNATPEELRYVAETLLLCLSTISLKGVHLSTIESARGMPFIRELCDKLMEGDIMMPPYRNVVAETIAKWQLENGESE